MTTASINLTELQRQQLLEVFDRRLKKMTDSALLELERLTRHPVDLDGFQAKPNDLVVSKIELTKVEDKKTNQVIDAVFSAPVNRREFLAYSASGLLGLLLCGTGYGWLKSNESVEDLSATVTNVDSAIHGLKETIQALQETIHNSSEVISDLLNAYPQTIYSIAQLRDNIEKAQSLYSQLDETGMTIAEIIEFVVNIISFVPNTESYIRPVYAMLDMLKNIPDTIFAAEKALATLNLWFSEEPDQGISNRLFFPIQSVFQTIDNDIILKVESIQDRLREL